MNQQPDLQVSRRAGGMIQLVGEGGFEPPAFGTQSRHAAKLRHSPQVRET